MDHTLITWNFSLGGKIPEVDEKEEPKVDDSKLDESDSEVGQHFTWIKNM